ncbi:hypothetical protein BaRGS_00029758 [Batillaria attramentaria]|uniref:Uncharacterized protein n=1 Tax=Batillaria attramentaria TaxID=370345 RepID=A0ABD0JWG8_9CAEN
MVSTDGCGERKTVSSLSNRTRESVPCCQASFKGLPQSSTKDYVDAHPILWVYRDNVKTSVSCEALKEEPVSLPRKARASNSNVIDLSIKTPRQKRPQTFSREKFAAGQHQNSFPSSKHRAARSASHKCQEKSPRNWEGQATPPDATRVQVSSPKYGIPQHVRAHLPLINIHLPQWLMPLTRQPLKHCCRLSCHLVLRQMSKLTLCSTCPRTAPHRRRFYIMLLFFRSQLSEIGTILNSKGARNTK